MYLVFTLIAGLLFSLTEATREVLYYGLFVREQYSFDNIRFLRAQ